MRGALASLAALLLLPGAPAFPPIGATDASTDAPAGTATRLLGTDAGVLAQDESRVHRYDANLFSSSACITIVIPHTIVLAYTPPTDTLTLRIGRLEAVGEAGTATLRFTAPACARFEFAVEGTEVLAVAAYAVKVQAWV